jgi:hypothetical protein
MKYIFFLALCAFLFSCKKELSCESCIIPTTPAVTANAKIIWTGPVETDGCNWAIVIDNNYYHPNTLSSDYQHDQLDVVVKYEPTTDHFICGIAGAGLPIIKIINIRPQ